MVVVGRDEDHGRAARPVAEGARRVDAREVGQVDVEEDDVVVHARGERQGLAHGRRLADHLDAAVAVEQVAQLRPRGRLVVDDQGQERHHAAATVSGGAVGTRMETTVPNSGEETMRTRPSSP